MANKQVNALATLSGVEGDDLIPVFDASETGDEKLKKYTVQELKTDLTSMDPSAFGNWVPIGDNTVPFSIVTTDTFQSNIESESMIKISVIIESVATTTLQVGLGSTSTWDQVNTNYVGTVDSRRILENWSGSAILDIIFNPATKIFNITGTQYNGTSSANVSVSIKYIGSSAVNRIFFQSYNGGGNRDNWLR